MFSLPATCVTGLLMISTCMAGTAVIVHPSNKNALTDKEVSMLFLGKTMQYPDGSKAQPVDNGASSKSREAFNTTVLSKTEQQLKAYWAQQVFTGKSLPPKQLPGDKDVVDLVSKSPEAISYVDQSAVNDSVRVVLTF
jgi:ABC-type phosphate transport system substrate-binding protein